MFQNNNLENLELKLAKTRELNKEKFEKIEKEFKKDFSNFLENIFPDRNFSVKRLVSVYFQLEKIDNFDKNDTEIFKNSLKKSLEELSIDKEKQEKLFLKISSLEKNKNFFSEKMNNNFDVKKNKNFPILEDLKNKEILTETDLVDISIKFKETKDFLSSCKIVGKNKFEIIKKNYFELNDTKTENRILNFKNDFKNEIENCQSLKIYPNVVNFIGKNYTKLKLKNKIESKTERLRRMFKIVFLKLYRLKYSGIDIDEILNKIESMSDLDSMINLLLKFFEQLKTNPVLQKDYLITDEIDETEDLVNEAENNKEKSIFTENKIIEAGKILEETEKKLTGADLEKILSEEIDLVGGNFVDRCHKNETCNFLFSDLEKQKNEKEIEEEDLIKIFEDLKEETFALDNEKRKMFLVGNYDKIDEINEKLIEVVKKLEKIKKLLGIGDKDELDEEENVILV